MTHIITEGFIPYEELQKQERRKLSIGASEVATVLGLNRWQTPYELWQVKTGKKDHYLDNIYTRAGHLLEPVVAQYFEEESGQRVIKRSAKDITYVHPEYRFITATPDREYFLKQGGRGLLECKATQKQFDKEAPPIDYYCQCQWQMGVMKAQGKNDYQEVTLAWLERGLKFDYTAFEYDREFFEEMVGRVSIFWEKNVQADIPPEPIRSSDIELIYGKSRKGTVKEVSEEQYDDYLKLSNIKNNIKQLKQEEAEMVEAIKMQMLDTEELIYMGETLLTWRTSRQSYKIDTKKLEQELPDIAEAYTVEKKRARPFLVK